MATDTTTSLNEQIDAIVVRVDPEARRFIRGERRRIFACIEEAAKEVARRDRTEISGMEIEYSELLRQRDDPFLALRVYTGPRVTPEVAFSYWDALGKLLENGRMAFDIDEMFAKKITFSIEWAEPSVD